MKRYALRVRVDSMGGKPANRYSWIHGSGHVDQRAPASDIGSELNSNLTVVHVEEEEHLRNLWNGTYEYGPARSCPDLLDAAGTLGLTVDILPSRLLFIIKFYILNQQKINKFLIEIYIAYTDEYEKVYDLLLLCPMKAVSRLYSQLWLHVHPTYIVSVNG